MLAALFKFSFAAAIIYWLIDSDKLDPALMNKLIGTGPNLYIGAIIMLTTAAATCYRWKILLEVKSDKKLPFFQVLPVHWIGLFFSTFLPGIVTGDVVKLLYIKDLDSKFSKTFLLTSVVVDRIFGLCGLLLLSGVISLIEYNQLLALSPKLKPFIHFNFLLFLGAFVFFMALFMPIKVQEKIIALVEKLPVIGKKFGNLFEQVWLFGKYKKTTMIALLISVFTQTLGVLAIWVLSNPFYGKEIPFELLFGFIPIGFIAVSIPISPSGAGVGHFIFDELFSLVGVQGGASLFNIYFIVLIGVNLIGAVPYLFTKKKHSIKEAEVFEEDGIEKA